MNVLFAIVEMSPLAKVGGLGDVAGSLPRALRARGADVRVAMPLHGVIDRSALSLETLATSVRVPWPGGRERVALLRTEVRGVPVYLIENERYFGRPKIYGQDDDLERMLLFCDALLACAPHLGFAPDVIHSHDWHAALLFSRLAADRRQAWAACGRVFTIHNLALQGTFDDAFVRRAGLLPELLLAPDALDSAVTRSAMAQGILHADRVNTVSETYAKEILTPEYGAGLDPLLRARAAIVSGIVNGIDYEEFDPATDPALVANYSSDDIAARAANKRALQEQAGLPIGERTMLFGVVTRLFPQKGIDLVVIAFARLLANHDAQLVVLGTGDEAVHDMLLRLQAKYPKRVKIWLDFDPPLGQRIYAGCDCFLMPSRYEPCGLGQLISLRYGAVPLVRRTGGLADTVKDAGLAQSTANGFTFDAPDARALEQACGRALAAFAQPGAWRALQERGMREDWSWNRAAGTYLDLYEQARAARKAAAA